VFDARVSCQFLFEQGYFFAMNVVRRVQDLLDRFVDFVFVSAVLPVQIVELHGVVLKGFEIIRRDAGIV
jgi:hypothetical protein